MSENKVLKHFGGFAVESQANGNIQFMLKKRRRKEGKTPPNFSWLLPRQKPCMLKGTWK